MAPLKICDSNAANGDLCITHSDGAGVGVGVGALGNGLRECQHDVGADGHGRGLVSGAEGGDGASDGVRCSICGEVVVTHTGVAVARDVLDGACGKLHLMAGAVAQIRRGVDGQRAA